MLIIITCGELACLVGRLGWPQPNGQENRLAWSFSAQRLIPTVRVAKSLTSFRAISHWVFSEVSSELARQPRCLAGNQPQSFDYLFLIILEPAA